MPIASGRSGGHHFREKPLASFFEKGPHFAG
jgi:hypothetical protein